MEDKFIINKRKLRGEDGYKTFSVRIKKLFRFIISIIFVERKKQSGAVTDVLDTPINIAGCLCKQLKSHRHKGVEQTVEFVTMHRFAHLLCKKLCLMKSTSDASLFIAMYHDAVMFVEGIEGNRFIDTASRALAKLLLDSLVHLTATNNSPHGSAIYEVVFGRGIKRYCYKGKTERFNVGQYVFVPVGERGEIRVVRIVGAFSPDEYHGDFLADKMKEIISNAFSTVVVAEAMNKNNC